MLNLDPSNLDPSTCPAVFTIWPVREWMWLSGDPAACGLCQRYRDRGSPLPCVDHDDWGDCDGHACDPSPTEPVCTCCIAPADAALRSYAPEGRATWGGAVHRWVYLFRHPAGPGRPAPAGTAGYRDVYSASAVVTPDAAYDEREWSYSVVREASPLVIVNPWTHLDTRGTVDIHIDDALVKSAQAEGRAMQCVRAMERDDALSRLRGPHA